jgi:hypothetical protein
MGEREGFTSELFLDLEISIYPFILNITIVVIYVKRGKAKKFGPS